MIKGHPQQMGVPFFAPLHGYLAIHVVGFSFSPSLTAGESADVTQAEDKAADRNGRAAKQ